MVCARIHTDLHRHPQYAQARTRVTISIGTGLNRKHSGRSPHMAIGRQARPVDVTSAHRPCRQSLTHTHTISLSVSLAYKILTYILMTMWLGGWVPDLRSRSRGAPERLFASKCFILDMDGVVYHGDRLLPGVREFVQWLRAAGRPFLFLTNGSVRTPAELRAKLGRMGLDVPASAFHTSAISTAMFLQSQVHPRPCAHAPMRACVREWEKEQAWFIQLARRRCLDRERCNGLCKRGESMCCPIQACMRSVRVSVWPVVDRGRAC
jgi:hypothetical protein